MKVGWIAVGVRTPVYKRDEKPTVKYLLASLLLVLIGPSARAADGAATAKSETEAAEFCVVGYLPYWEFKSFDAAVGKQLTDVICFSIEPTREGEVNHRDITAAALDQLHQMREKHGTRIEIAVGGWGRAKALGTVAVDQAKRQRFVAALAKYCDENKFDGVDFDWEFPKGKEQIAAYGELLSECKAALGPRHRLVTMAVSPDQELPAAAIQAVDRVHLMSYDHDGPEHSTAAQAEADVKQVLARGVPKSKLVLGVPFYGRNRNGSPSELGYTQIVRRFHPAPGSDSEQGYYFNGSDTIRAKTRSAKSQHLGVMIWELGQDTNDETSLLRAIHAEVGKQ